ncbi:BTB/POZ protein [Rhizophagus clarus]|uniref:BTB/POZ protein n=1 Tax=Rhizophagus clarus TaxID=94130 RepID=A0A8H3LW05_9GLOM|nr:BTB/POZ protein [Rhizophagus clarus]
MMAKKFLQNLLDDKEFYDITIEVGGISLEECNTSEIFKILDAAEPAKIFKSPNYFSILENLLISLIQNDYLQMSEVQVWEQVIKWGLARNPELLSDFTNYSKNDSKL